MRLRRKITLAFFGISSLVSLLLALVLYRFIEGKLEDDLRDGTLLTRSVLSRAAGQGVFHRRAAYTPTSTAFWIRLDPEIVVPTQ